MRVRSLALGMLAFGTALFFTLPLLAHHSFAMFEMNKTVEFKGTVVEYRWENPHTHIIVRVPSGPEKGVWDIECQSVNIMERQGWNRITYKAGDPIDAFAHPMKDGSKGASIFYVVKDGHRMYGDIARPMMP